MSIDKLKEIKSDLQEVIEALSMSIAQHEPNKATYTKKTDKESWKSKLEKIERNVGEVIIDQV